MIQVFVVRNDYRDPLSNNARIIVADGIPGMLRRRLLKRDGSWYEPTEGQELPDDVGYLFPQEGIEALAQAINQYLGKASHAATEVAVLREWLAAERERADRLIFPMGYASGLRSTKESA